MLSSLLDVIYESDAIVNWAAAADDRLWLALGYNYKGYVMMNYHYAHAVLDSSTRTDLQARAARIFAGSCAFIEYLLRSVGRLAVCVCVVARTARRRSKMAMEAIDCIVVVVS